MLSKTPRQWSTREISSMTAAKVRWSEPGPAPALVDRAAEEAEFGHLAQDVGRKVLVAVVVAHARGYLGSREIAYEPDQLVPIGVGQRHDHSLTLERALVARNMLTITTIVINRNSLACRSE